MDDIPCLVTKARSLNLEITDTAERLNELAKDRHDVIAKLVKLGMTQREIAAEIGLSQARISQILGITRPVKAVK